MALTLNGTTYTTGATNGAAADLMAGNALMDQVDVIVNGWSAKYATDGNSFYRQGGSAGVLTGGSVIGTLFARLTATQANLNNMRHG